MSTIAREAGTLLMQYFHQGLKIEYKGDADLVTAADRASETLIRQRITQQFPGHDVLGEEQGLNDQGSDYRWYVACLWLWKAGLWNIGQQRREHELPEWFTIRRATNYSLHRGDKARSSTGSQSTFRKRRS